MIVFESADLDSVTEGLVDAIWFNQGQVRQNESKKKMFPSTGLTGERSGSVVECLTQD